MLPFIIGTAIAFLVQRPAAVLSEKIKVKQGTASLCLVILVYILLLAVIFLIINKIYGFAVSLSGKIPDYLTQITALVTKISDSLKCLTVKISGTNEDVI